MQALKTLRNKTKVTKFADDSVGGVPTFNQFDENGVYGMGRSAKRHRSLCHGLLLVGLVHDPAH